MREKFPFNEAWRVLVDPPEGIEVQSKNANYLTAKTERLKWGPGNYQHCDLSEHWDFDGEYFPEKWQEVNLPHDYIISQDIHPEESGTLGFYHYTNAWYRKHFNVSPEDQGKRLVFYFEGITGICDVYLNGCFLKHHNGSFSPFEADITDIVRFDRENVLAIHIDPRSYETWWYAGGGICRNVWLEKTSLVAVDRWGIFVHPEKQTGDAWRVPVEVTLRNDSYEDASVEAVAEVLGPDGTLLVHFAMQGSVLARSKTTIAGKTDISSPLLWDIEKPILHTLRITLKHNGAVTDIIEQTFGFRTFKFDAKEGFLLNGRNVKLQGVCMHGDCGLLGRAVPDNICRYKLHLLKEMGVNALRTSHYPHNEATMDECDHCGILVMDETRRFESNDEAIEQLQTLVLRDRNHPSVILWSTGNEEMVYHTIPQGHNIHRAMEHVIRRLDPTRPVTTAITQLDRASVQEISQVIGVNYSLDFIDDNRARFPDRPFVSSENSAAGTTRGWYYGNCPERGLFDARDRDPHSGDCWYGREYTWKFIMERPWIGGGFQWSSFEYLGEAVWPRIGSISGAIDLFLQKKDAFWLNLSHWSKEPMVHLLPHWNHRGLEGCNILVWAYTNCPQAELFLDGKSLGLVDVPLYGHAEWNVPFQPGRLSVKTYRDGQIVAEDAHETTGPAYALKLQLDNTPIVPNGQDVAVFTCTVLDQQGREVPDATPFVRFAANGCGRIVGTGSSNTDHTSIARPERQMFAGRISVAVRLAKLSPGEHGELTLLAQADGLRSALCKLSL
ncbi:MAG: DUF4982 domain-containing protein [Victivallales bacterium]|nr:DUF4982 domain-containing protein [Victivallales bacterium]